MNKRAKSLATVSVVIGLAITLASWSIKSDRNIGLCLGKANFSQKVYGAPVPYYYQKYGSDCYSLNLLIVDPPQGVNKLNLLVDVLVWSAAAFVLLSVADKSLRKNK